MAQDSAPEDEHFGDSQDESKKVTIHADMYGAIDEDQKVEIRQSALSHAKIDDAQVKLDEGEDDFMDTYLAINLDVKVRES